MTSHQDARYAVQDSTVRRFQRFVFQLAVHKALQDADKTGCALARLAYHA